MISSELPEILGMSDRIIVMNEGRVTGEIEDCARRQSRRCDEICHPKRGKGCMLKINFRTFLSVYGNVLVLLLLCLCISLVTIEKQSATSSSAARELALEVSAQNPPGSTVLVLVRAGEGASLFANTLTQSLSAEGLQVVGSIVGTPADARKALESQRDELTVLVTGEHMAVFASGQLPELASENDALAQTKTYRTETYLWPNFLKKDNLFNVLKQVSVVAIIAIGMTLIIITAGIDLSVGSLIAFSGVVTALTIQKFGGAEPTTTDLWLGSLAGILICALSEWGRAGW